MTETGTETETETETEPRMAIVVPVFNRRASTRRCLQSLHELRPAGSVVVVVDSGSTDGTPGMIAECFPEVVLLSADPSLWWTGATNCGVRWALANDIGWIVTYNDDNVASEGLFARLQQTATEQPDALVAAVCVHLQEPDRVLFAGRRRAGLGDRFRYLDLDRSAAGLVEEVREVDLLHGMCTLAPAAAFTAIGLFDEQTFPHLYGDDDFALRARAGGYRLLVDTRATVLNDRSLTGLNPYDRRLSATGIGQLLTSRKSTFQLRSRSAFLWRHRRSTVRFLFTWLADYLRLAALVLVRQVLSQRQYERLQRAWLRRVAP